jgi:hypothetical protein
MANALETLELRLSENTKRLTAIDNQISDLLKESEEIKKNNEHLNYSISIINSPVTYRVISVNINNLLPVESNHGKDVKKTLRETILDVIKDGESIKVGDAWYRVTTAGINTTRATINATLHTLVKDKVLVRPAIGFYKKAL